MPVRYRHLLGKTEEQHGFQATAKSTASADIGNSSERGTLLVPISPIRLFVCSNQIAEPVWFSPHKITSGADIGSAFIERKSSTLQLFEA